MSLSKLIDLIEAVTKTKLEKIRVPDVRKDLELKRVGDTSELHKLGWDRKIDIESGLSKLKLDKFQHIFLNDTIGRTVCRSKEIDAVSEVIKSGWLTQGPVVANFGKEFATYCNAKFAVAVSSCTTGLHLALKAVGVKENDEVIVPSLSYIATANAIRYCGAIPCFVDVLKETRNLNPELVERAITKTNKSDTMRTSDGYAM